MKCWRSRTEQCLSHAGSERNLGRIEGVSKTLYYEKLGIHFVLAQEQVYMLGVNDQARLLVGEMQLGITRSQATISRQVPHG
jgi:hypothetical protein